MTIQRNRKRVEVQCKTCKKTFMKMVESMLMWQGNCQPCAARLTCRTRAGKTDTDPILAKIYVPVICSVCSKQWKKRQDSLVVWNGRCRTCGNVNWNPNRELVAQNERARKESYSLIHNTLRRLSRKKNHKSAELLGYTHHELFDHLNKQLHSGMSWAERGLWHIDHIKPVSAFSKEGITDLKIINALSNLRPLWKAENMAKGGRGTNWTVIGK